MKVLIENYNNFNKNRKVPQIDEFEGLIEWESIRDYLFEHKEMLKNKISSIF